MSHQAIMIITGLRGSFLINRVSYVAGQMAHVPQRSVGSVVR